MTKLVFLFPGQGSQFIGMGKVLYETFSEAKEVYQEVDEALHRNLSKIIFGDNAEELTQTANAQPAIMATSIATLNVLLKQSKRSIESLATSLAGHSLGEYSALCAAESFSLKDTAQLLHVRGTSMQEAIPIGKGAMAALIGAEIENTKKLLTEVSTLGVCQIANDNGSGQIVISGDALAVEKCISLAANFGIRKAIKLSVSAPFHCDLMKPAAEKMFAALSQTNIESPMCDTISNITVEPYKDAEDIKVNLVKQVTSMVRWRETMEYFIKNGNTHFVEIGPGKVLSGLAKRIDDRVTVSNILEPQDLDTFFNNYN